MAMAPTKRESRALLSRCLCELRRGAKVVPGSAGGADSRVVRVADQAVAAIPETQVGQSAVAANAASKSII